MKKSRRLKREFFGITKFAKRFNREKQKYVIDIAYKTGVEITPRSTAVAEAFGLGIDKEKQFVIYDYLELEIGEADIVYVTGDSGSGKSVLLNKFAEIFKDEAGNMNQVAVEETKPLVDTLGKSTEEAIELLSLVGLNDAFLFLRKYSELSDGQKYRYRLAKMTKSQASIWFCDEFCSLLDRDTAKIVAYNLQKLARKLRRGVFVATCHTDLLEDLKPDVYIHKRFGKEVTVMYYEPRKEFSSECSLLRNFEVQKGTTQDYRKLAEFHYRSHRLPPPRAIFRAVRNGEVVGVIVYSYPSPVVSGRKKIGLDKMSLHELNETLSSISRVVVHPKYRSIGLGQKLVRETLPRNPAPMVETIAVMARYNPFFEKAGMQKICEVPPAKKALKIMSCLPRFGFNIERTGSANYNLSVLKILSEKQLSELRLIFAKNIHPRLMKYFFGRKPFGKRIEYVRAIMNASLEKLASLIKVVALLCQVKVYLFWRSPKWEKRLNR